MKRYAVNKYLRYLQMDREALLLYSLDPERSVAEWEEDRAALPITIHGGALLGKARVAMVSLDLPTLYQMGAHPYMLWHLYVDVMTARGSIRQDIFEAYGSQIESLGNPDFST